MKEQEKKCKKIVEKYFEEKVGFCCKQVNHYNRNYNRDNDEK